VLTPREALKEGAPKVHDDRDNLFFRQPIIFGEAEPGVSEDDFAVAAHYTTQTVEHAYLEPDSGGAFIHENGQLVVLAGSQNIHAHQKTIAGAIGLSIEQVRVIQPTR
jgi:CO/xanthine dehydrogenase Mo-binding subunit